MKNLNIFLVIVLSIFIGYGIFLSLGLKEGFPEKQYGNGFFSFLSEKPLTEDGFYALTVSWNIASGYGITYNREIPTTGFQPLSTFIHSALAYVVITFGGDKYSFLRAVLIFSVLLQVLFAFLIYKITKVLTRLEDKKILFLVSALSVLFNFKLFMIFTNGLENGIYLVGLACLLYYLLKDYGNKDSSPNISILGLLSGLLLLSRTDFIVILLPLLFIMIIKRTLRIHQVILICLYAFIIFTPWLVYNYSVTGSLLSSAAQIQTGIINSFALDQRFDHFFFSLIQYLTPFLYTGIQLKTLFYLMGIAYIGLMVFLFRYFYKEIFIAEKIKWIMWFAIPFTLLLVTYLVCSSTPYNYLRYFSYLTVIVLPLFVIIISKLAQRIREAFAHLFYILVLLLFFIQTSLYYHSGKSAMSYAYRPGYIQKNFKSGAKISAFQTGTLGYFLPNVYNLDGKVDIDAAKYGMDGNIHRYIDMLGIEVFVEWKLYLPNINESYLKKIGFCILQISGIRGLCVI
jgi:hypothetical protein